MRTTPNRPTSTRLRSQREIGPDYCPVHQLEPGQVLGTVHLTSALPLGNYPCTATVTRLENGAETETLKLNVALRVAYLWAQ